MIKMASEKSEKEEEKGKKKIKKPSVTTGKRKTAIARASVKEVGEGRTGEVIVNSKPLDVWGNEVLRLWVREPLELAGEYAKNLNVSVSVRGGGLAGQAEAVRVAIARGIVKFLKDRKESKKEGEKLKGRYLTYDRNLLVYDSRRTEVHKPSRSKQGARRHKQRSKR